MLHQEKVIDRYILDIIIIIICYNTPLYVICTPPKFSSMLTIEMSELVARTTAYYIIMF